MDALSLLTFALTLAFCVGMLGIWSLLVDTEYEVYEYSRDDDVAQIRAAEEHLKHVRMRTSRAIEEDTWQRLTHGL